MDGNKKVKVVSLVNCSCLVVLPNLNFRREWNSKGQVVTIPYEILEEGMFDPGFRNMIEDGVLFIDDLEAAKALGLEADDAKEPTTYKTYTELELKKLIVSASFEDFKAALEVMPKEQIHDLTDWAITLRMRDPDKVELLSKISNVDIDKAIYRDKESQVKEG